MAGKQEPGPKWRQTSVLIRSDIFEEAQKAGLDIDEECNRALAEKVRIDYRQQKIPEGTTTGPVMIAPNDHSAVRPATVNAPESHPAPKIINAEAPGAAKAVKEQQNYREKTPAKPPLSLPGRVSAPARTPEPEPVPTAESQTPPATPEKPARKKAASKKADAVKNFFSMRVERIDTESAIIAKDEIYDAFARWCQDHRISPVPDKRVFSVALKTKFAVHEKIIDGSAMWVGIWLKERR